jgi:hypothetical protein
MEPLSYWLTVTNDINFSKNRNLYPLHFPFKRRCEVSVTRGASEWTQALQCHCYPVPSFHDVLMNYDLEKKDDAFHRRLKKTADIFASGKRQSHKPNLQSVAPTFKDNCAVPGNRKIGGQNTGTIRGFPSSSRTGLLTTHTD